MHSDSSRQSDPTPAADSKHEFKLPIQGFTGTPEQIERQWFENVYKGQGDSMPQLTWRAVVMGAALGGVLSLTNLYIGLKAGWSFGVAITACILSYAIWTGMFKIGIAKTQMSILENNCMQSDYQFRWLFHGQYILSRPLPPISCSMGNRSHWG